MYAHALQTRWGQHATGQMNRTLPVPARPGKCICPLGKVYKPNKILDAVNCVMILLIV